MKSRAICELLGIDPATCPEFECSSITEDSRRVMPGSIFTAVRGEHSDGHAHIAQALAAGAVAVLSGREEADGEAWPVPVLRVASPRLAVSRIAHALAGNPSRSMSVIGITGTNGKSSTAYLTQAILREAGFACANFGTMGYEIDGVLKPSMHTTPFGEDLARMFTDAKDAGQTHVVMETSSHALAQGRVAGIQFQVGAFTNLTQDHLDYHPDMDAYREAKLKLFESVDGPDSFTVVNLGDPSGEAFVRASKTVCFTYGKGGDCKAKKIGLAYAGTTFTLKTPWGRAEVVMKLLGKHNAMNALCAATICGGLGVPVDVIVQGIEKLKCVPGRFEAVDAGQSFHVIVDYAHTEDGLLNVLQAARALCKKRVILVFGCGGDRDTGKRPKMGAAAAGHADYAIATSDNPRTEDPRRILLDIEVGMQRAGGRKNETYTVIENRDEAIREALRMAREKDLVLIAGKGHEDYQILGKERIHFDDREVARAILMDMQS